MKYWYKIHKWASLICAVFLLSMCASALPLIFGREIAAFNQVSVPTASEASLVDLTKLSVGKQAETVLERYPGYNLRAVYLDHEKHTNGFSIRSQDKGYEYARLDLNTGLFIERSNEKVRYEVIPKFIEFAYRMHVDMYLGSFGRNLFGAMCGLSVVALLSGIWLYAPFMKNISFGTIRSSHRRIYWMDWHKLLGIATLSWAVLLSVSGFIFIFAGPVHNAWNESIRKEFLIDYQDKPFPVQRISIDEAMEVAQAALPDRRITGIEVPQEDGKMRWHYMVRTQGEGWGAHLNKPVWVDASTGKVTAVIQQPWYIQTLSMANPVHFSNHDTLPLKILWFITDALTCIMIITGIYAWFVKFRPNKSNAANRQQAKSVPPVRQSSRQIWLLPVVIILITLFGIIAPLAGKEWSTISAVALAIPLVLTGYYWLRS
ncbi:MAG: PepSY domain containing protein [Neobacillus sp.]|nr:PepSY domain containing protein [Neobacillus sp.]